MTSERMRRLLKGITNRSFKPQPRGVGLKTVIEALEAGLIEIEGNFQMRRVRCKLTPLGHAVANDLSSDRSD